MMRVARALFVTLGFAGALSACSGNGAEQDEPKGKATPEAIHGDEAAPAVATPRVTLSEAAARTARIV
ncbi:MAG: hypothetical protein C0497_15685, partial [Gemmatimonas sp.]|nr:hypothetical protein [Gemmatimonas sp.]